MRMNNKHFPEIKTGNDSLVNPLPETTMPLELQQEIRALAPYKRVILEVDMRKNLRFVETINRLDVHARKLIEGDFDFPR